MCPKKMYALLLLTGILHTLVPAHSVIAETTCTPGEIIRKYCETEAQDFGTPPYCVRVVCNDNGEEVHSRAPADDEHRGCCIAPTSIPPATMVREIILTEPNPIRSQIEPQTSNDTESEADEDNSELEQGGSNMVRRLLEGIFGGRNKKEAERAEENYKNRDKVSDGTGTDEGTSGEVGEGRDQTQSNNLNLRISNQTADNYNVEEVKFCVDAGEDCRYLQFDDDEVSIAAEDSREYVFSEMKSHCQDKPSGTIYGSVSNASTSDEDETWTTLTMDWNCQKSPFFIITDEGYTSGTEEPPKEDTIREDSDNSWEPVIINRGQSESPFSKANETATYLDNPYRPNPRPQQITSRSRIILHHFGGEAHLAYNPKHAQTFHKTHELYDRYDIAYHYVIQDINGADPGGISIYEGRDMKYAPTTSTLDKNYNEAWIDANGRETCIIENSNMSPAEKLEVTEKLGASCNAIHIAVVGDFDKYEANQELVDTIINLMVHFSEKYNLQPRKEYNLASDRTSPDHYIYGHTDFVGKSYSCPGNNLYNYQKPGMQYFREEVDRRRSNL